MIQMYHVDLRYAGGTYGLRDVSLVLEKGDFVFLTGSSGAGKTSLLRLLFGAESPSAGQILVAGRNITRLPASQIPQLRRQIGVIFQDFKLLPERTVFENVAIALEIAGVSRSEIRTRVWSMLKRLGLAHRIDHKPRMLSGGEQQRVATARALVTDPALLLADEPTGNLDPETSIDIMRLLYRINRTGTTILVATHDQAMVDKMRRRVLELSGGRIVRDEATGLYTRDESTREFAQRMRAPSVRPRGV